MDDNKPVLTLGRAIQVLALQSVETPSDDSTYREVCRWFSKTFATPLYTVEMDLDPQYVLQHFYESILKDMKDKVNDGDEKAKANYDRYASSIVNPSDEGEAQDEDEAWAKEMLRELKEQEDKKSAPVIPPLNLNINQLKLTEEDRKALAEDISKEFKRTVSGEADSFEP